MKFKLALLFILISGALSAQNFFKPIPKLMKRPGNSLLASAALVPLTKDSTFNSFRPKAVAATLFINGTVEAAAGVGLAYQNITQRSSDGRNYVNWDAGLYTMAGGSVVPNRVADVEKFGLIVTALNGTVGVGYAISRQANVNPLITKRTWKGGLALVWTINFNN